MLNRKSIELLLLMILPLLLAGAIVRPAGIGSSQDAVVVQAPPVSKFGSSHLMPTVPIQYYLPLAMRDFRPLGSSHGIVALSFVVENPTVSAYQNIWFDFQVTNTLDMAVPISVLGAHIEDGPTASSWHDPLAPHHEISWRDHMNLSTTGSYLLYLGVCYGGLSPCLANQADWERLSEYVPVTVH
jgi:hypothetical protein